MKHVTLQFCLPDAQNVTHHFTVVITGTPGHDGHWYSDAPQVTVIANLQQRIREVTNRDYNALIKGVMERMK